MLFIVYLTVLDPQEGVFPFGAMASLWSLMASEMGDNASPSCFQVGGIPAHGEHVVDVRTNVEVNAFDLAVWLCS